MSLANISVLFFLLVLLLMIILHCWRADRPFSRLCVYIRLFLGLVFLTSGFSKLAHQMGVNFGSVIGPVWLENKLAPHGLALFGRFIACAQVIIGLCLLSSRLMTLGAIMLMPMLLCIWVVTISMNFRNTPYIVATMLLMNLMLLVHDWHKLKFILTEKVEELRPLRPVLQFRIADKIWLAGAFISLAAIVVFHLWPQHGPRTVKAGLLFMLVSSFFYLRKARTEPPK